MIQIPIKSVASMALTKKDAVRMNYHQAADLIG